MKRLMLFTLAALLGAALVMACGKQQEQKPTQKPAETTQTMEHGQMGGMMQSGEMAADEVIDPVCGMKIKKADATHTMEYKGKTYYFCMEKDYQTFVANPDKYVAQQ